MKKFLVLLILAGAGVAGWWFWDPYIKEYVDPILAKLVGSSEEKEKEKSESEPSKADPKDTETKPPAPPATAKSTTPPAPDPAPAPPAPKPPPPQSEIDRVVAEMYPMPKILPLMEIVDNWKNVPQRAYPEKVMIKDRIGFSLRGSDGRVIGSSVVAEGNLVAPVRLDGQTLIVANLASPGMKSQIDVEKTNFKELIQKRYADFSVTMTQRIYALREKAKKNLQAKPEQLAALQNGTAWKDDGDPRFGPVKASLAAGDVKAFNLEEAVGFRWNGSERINGDRFRGTFDTVTVKYEARTIFGRFPGEMKCLLQNGKVVGWIDPLTEEERI